MVCTQFSQEQGGSGLIWGIDPGSTSKGNQLDRMPNNLESEQGAKIIGLVRGRKLKLQKTSGRLGP